MIDFDTLKQHLVRTGRIKLLPRILLELKREDARTKKLASKTESAHENPSLISGTRTLTDGVLVDHTGKRALLDIYQRITS